MSIVIAGTASIGASAPSAVAAPITLRFAPVATASITPGAQLTVPLDARTAAECTADFVFAGQKSLYLGFSAHCTATDDADGVDGCSTPTLPLGTAVTIRGRNGHESQGRLAYNSWRTMQARGEDSTALCTDNDFALVALDPADTALVNPSVPVLGGPTGLAAGGPERGEAVYGYGPNNGGSGVKRGTGVADTGGGRTHQVVVTPSGVPGDSGSGFLDADGRAFGVLSTRFLDSNRTNGVTDLARALSYAGRFGGLGRVTLVPGTAPFTPR